MSLPSTVRGSAFTADGLGLNGSGSARLGHRQGNLSRTSLLPSDSISQSGGMGGSRSATSKVFIRDHGWQADRQRPVPQKTIPERPGSGHHVPKDPEYTKLGILLGEVRLIISSCTRPSRCDSAFICTASTASCRPSNSI
jgi:hypothetical protein